MEGRRATLLLDESEDLADTERGKAISNLLLAGYQVGGETYRQEKVFGDNYKTMSFRVFSPKVIANIVGIKLPALRSRSIRIVMSGARDKQKANREPDVTSKAFQILRNNLYRYTLLHFQDIIQVRDELIDIGLTGRALTIWQGILTIARLVGLDKFEVIREYATGNYHMIQEEIAEEDSGAALIRSLYNLVSEKGEGEYTTGALMAEVMVDEEMEFSSPKAFGMAMKRLGLPNKLRRHGSKVVRVYALRKKVIFDKMERLSGHVTNAVGQKDDER